MKTQSSQLALGSKKDTSGFKIIKNITFASNRDPSLSSSFQRPTINANSSARKGGNSNYESTINLGQHATMDYSK